MTDPVSASDSPLPHVDCCPVPVSADLHVVLQHNEQLAPGPGPGVSPGPGLIYPPVHGLHVDLLPAMWEPEPPGESLHLLALG